MKSLFFKIFSILLSLFIIGSPAYAISIDGKTDGMHLVFGHNETFENEIKNEATLKAETWVKENYSSYYKIRNLSINLGKSSETKNELLYTLDVEFETCPIFTDSRQTPFGKGVLDACYGIRLSSTEKSSIDKYFDALNADAAFNEYSGVFIEIVASYNKNSGSLDLYYKNGFDEQLRSIEEIEIVLFGITRFTLMILFSSMMTVQISYLKQCPPAGCRS